MKTLAQNDARTTSSTKRRSTSSLHSPQADNARLQRATIHQIVQPKLTVGKANDQYEQEADRVADRVVANQPVPDISSISSNPASGNLQTETLEDEEQEVQRQIEEEEEEVQPRLIQRQAEEEEEEPIQAKGAMPYSELDPAVISSQSAGTPLRPDVRNALESGMGADLSNVRIHEDGSARAAAASINARAFTHKNDIWLGEGQSQSDLHLMAHESTHVVQQRGGLRAASKEISSATPRVQRLWNPISAIGDAVSSAVEWVGDTIGEAIDYLKERAVEFVQDIPGYSLFTVINGSDPITGHSVDRNGRNFIEAGLDIIPNGQALKQKLEDEGALEEAAQWLDLEIAEMDFNPAEIMSQLSSFWNSLSISDAASPGDVLDRLFNIINPPIGRIIRFAGNVATKLLQIVKNYVVSALIDFIREHTTAYPLLTVILERDPISNEAVERTPMALLRGFMQLSESGAEQLRQMEESGSLQRAADWLDGTIERLNLSWETIRETFSQAWDLVTIQNLLNPLAIFRELYNLFAAPVGRIINFVIEIAVKVLGLIKDALINRLVAYARTVRGYPLITVILGRDPFSQEPVERTTANIIRGFMSLMENGEQQYLEMEQSGAIADMTARVEAAMAMLNFTWEYIRGLFTRAWDSFSLQDLAAPFEAFARLMGYFADPVMRLVSFVWEIIKIVIEVVMKVMNFPIDLIRNIISRAMQAMDDIKRDPIAFLKNLLRAVKNGFVKFFDNIATHLLNGVTSWLFKELEDAGVSPPTDFSFQAILGFVLDVLGISVDRIFQKLADRIGQDKVDRIRGMLDRLTGIWSFVSDVMTRGPIAIWEYIQEQLSNLWNVVLDAVRNWVVTRIIQQITVKLLSMLDPTGIMAVVNSFIAFYKAIQSFIAYLREMLEIVNSFVEGVAEIARGSVETAASFLESSLARGVPIVIGFLANQVGLGGLGRRIGEMIERVREMVDGALTWLVDKAVSMGTSFLNAVGLGGGGAEEDEAEPGSGAEGDWRDQEGEFREDGEQHEVTFNSNNIMIASKTPKSLETRLQEREQQSPELTPDQRAAITMALGKKPELVRLEQRYAQAQMDSDRNLMLSVESEIGAKLQEIANIIRDANLFLGDSSIPEVVDILDSGGNVKISGFSRNTRTGVFDPSLFDGSTTLSKIRYQSDQADSSQSQQTVDLENQVDLDYSINQIHGLGYAKPANFRAVDRGNEEEGSSYQRQRDAFPAISRNWFAETAPGDMDRIGQLNTIGLVSINIDGIVRGASKWVYIHDNFLSASQKAKIPKPVRKESMVAILNDNAQFNDAERENIRTRWKVRWGQSTHVHHITPLNFGGSNTNFVPLSAEKHIGSGGVHPGFWSRLKPFLIRLRNLGQNN